jgi:hypothetical protein
VLTGPKLNFSIIIKPYKIKFILECLMSKTGIFAKSDPIFKMIFGDPENKTALIGSCAKLV